MSSPAAAATTSTSKDSPGHESTLSLAGGPETSSLYRDPSFASLGTNSSGQEEFYSCMEHAENALKQMETYFENQLLCDVVLIAGVDGKRFDSKNSITQSQQCNEALFSNKIYFFIDSQSLCPSSGAVCQQCVL